LHWLQEKRFYLSAEICEQAKALKTPLESASHHLLTVEGIYSAEPS